MTLTRQHYAVAASLAALVIAAPLALHVSERGGGTPDATPGAIATGGEPRKDPVDGDVHRKAEEEQRRHASEAAAQADAARKRVDESVVAADKPALLPAPSPAPLWPPVALAPSATPPASAPLAPPAIPAAPSLRVPEPAPAPPPAIAFAPDQYMGLRSLAEPSYDRYVPGEAGGAGGGVEPDVAPPREESRDRFASADVNPVKQVASDPVSTFSIDVDTASYSFVRRALNAGRLPPPTAVRTEEMINYFRYDYSPAASAAEPFKPTVTVVPSPWNADNLLVHIGIKGYELKSAERPRANLVFLVDVSGSMAPDDRLPLVRNGLRMLIEELKPDDTVAIVTYASGSGIALEPTKIADKAKILSALEGLRAGGSTAGASGIEDAYRLAEANFDKAAVNRIILATDGDFNVGVTDDAALKGLVERKRASGIFLSIVGVGAGNYNDRLVQALAQNGNGVAAYADTLSEARKILVEQASSILFPIARDVKIQVEWNPARVSEYRLIGYETRALKREDFNNDRVDAGDIGSGHTVTAIYEITPAGAARKSVDALRYATPAKPSAPSASPAAAPAAPDTVPAGSLAAELGHLKIRYKLPGAEVSTPISLAIGDALAKPSLEAAPADTRFSVAVAAFAERLRNSPHIGTFGYDDILALAAPARDSDPYGERAEFLNLVRLAKSAAP